MVPTIRKILFLEFISVLFLVSINYLTKYLYFCRAQNTENLRYFQNAREKGVNSFLAFVLSLLLIFGFYVLTSMPFALYAQFQGVIGEDMSQYQGPLSFALLLFIFSGILFGVIVATKSIHKRPVLSVFTGAPSFRWSHAFRSAGIWFALMAVL